MRAIHHYLCQTERVLTRVISYSAGFGKTETAHGRWQNTAVLMIAYAFDVYNPTKAIPDSCIFIREILQVSLHLAYYHNRLHILVPGISRLLMNSKPFLSLGCPCFLEQINSFDYLAHEYPEKRHLLLPLWAIRIALQLVTGKLWFKSSFHHCRGVWATFFSEVQLLPLSKEADAIFVKNSIKSVCTFN